MHWKLTDDEVKAIKDHPLTGTYHNPAAGRYEIMIPGKAMPPRFGIPEHLCKIIGWYEDHLPIHKRTDAEKRIWDNWINLVQKQGLRRQPTVGRNGYGKMG